MKINFNQKTKNLAKKIATIFSIVLLSASIFISGFIEGSRYGFKINLPSPFEKIVNKEKPKELPAGNMDVFWETWTTILEKYVDRDKLVTQKMIEGASRGLVDSLEDPHSEFLNSEQAQKLNEELSGEFYGVGMEITKKDGFLVVISPLPDTPAEKVGLKPNDRILKINGEETLNLSSLEAAELIRGPKNTSVSLVIFRSEWNEAKEIKIIREKISIPSVDWQMLDNKIAYLKIYNFNQPLSSKFYQIALEIFASQPRGLIIDLRNNPGGFLESVVEISGWFLDKGEVILKEDLGNEEIKIYRASGQGLLKNIPSVVLINEGTASASEILAGALRDNREVKLVGMRSFGKGSVQELVNLKNGEAVKITIAKWLTPKGIIIDKNGLNPDFEVKNDDELGSYSKVDLVKDKQLNKAIVELQKLLITN